MGKNSGISVNRKAEFLMFSKIHGCVVNFLIREDGPTAVEYAIMLALITVACIVAITALGSNTNKTLTNHSNAIKVSGS